MTHNTGASSASQATLMPITTAVAEPTAAVPAIMVRFASTTWLQSVMVGSGAVHASQADMRKVPTRNRAAQARTSGTMLSGRSTLTTTGLRGSTTMPATAAATELAKTSTAAPNATRRLPRAEAVDHRGAIASSMAATVANGAQIGGSRQSSAIAPTSLHPTKTKSPPTRIRIRASWLPMIARTATPNQTGLTPTPLVTTETALATTATY